MIKLILILCASAHAADRTLIVLEVPSVYYVGMPIPGNSPPEHSIASTDIDWGQAIAEARPKRGGWFSSLKNFILCRSDSTE